MAVNKRLKKAKPKRANNRAASDGFLVVHWKQAKSSLSELWQRPLGNLTDFSRDLYGISDASVFVPIG